MDRPWTEDEKKELGPILRRTWQYIAADAEEGLTQGSSPRKRKQRQDEIIELCIDANRAMTCGGATAEQDKLLSSNWRHSKNQAWLREVLNY